MRSIVYQLWIESSQYTQLCPQPVGNELCWQSASHHRSVDAIQVFEIRVLNGEFALTAP